MTGIIFYDPIVLFASVAEMSQSYTKAGSPDLGLSPVFTNYGRNLGKSFRPSARSGAAHIVKTVAPRSKIGACFSMRIPTPVTISYGYPFFVAGSSGRLATFSTSTSTAQNSGAYVNVPSDLITLSVGNAGTLIVEHSVQTSSTATTGISRLLLQSGTVFLLADVVYKFEVIADFSQAVATLKVYIDGVLVVDVTFNRDRVTPLTGILDDAFEYCSFGGLHTAATDAQNPHFADIVIYDPALTPGPIGPVALTYYPASNAAFSAVVNDATTISIPGVTLTEFDVAGMPATGQIIAAYIAARSKPTTPDAAYNVEFKASMPAGTPEHTLITGPIQSGSPVRRDERIPGVDDFADLVGMKLKARSR